MEAMIDPQLPAGYRQVADPNDVARALLAASTWAVLALTCHAGITSSPACSPRISAGC
jgi:hypothetical protein